MFGVLEIFDRCWRFLMGILKIFNGCPGDICWVSWTYFMGVLEIFDVCPGGI